VKLRFILTRVSEILIVILSTGLPNATAFSFTLQFPVFGVNADYAWMILGLWLVLALMIFGTLAATSRSSEYLDTWKRQPTLVCFILFCMASLAWTTSIAATTFELVALLGATVAGVYLAGRYGLRAGFELLRWLGIVFVVASLALLFVYPPLARLGGSVYDGAWRGIFWHRNHMGSLMAFYSAVFLLKAFMRPTQFLAALGNGVLFVLSVILVLGSRSATGILILLLLDFGLALGFVWLQFRGRLRTPHYVAALAVLGLLALTVMSNLDAVFKLLGRSSTLTGRTPLWYDLIERVWRARPILGYGFGALWNQAAFRISLQLRHYWGFQVFFSDNGFIDLLLNLGGLGLAVFLAFFLVTGLRGFRVVLRSANPLHFFPFLIFVYVLIANISYSFLLEVDQFVWMLLVMSAVWSEYLITRPMPQPPGGATLT